MNNRQQQIQDGHQHSIYSGDECHDDLDPLRKHEDRDYDHRDRDDDRHEEYCDMPQSLVSSMHIANKKRIANECMQECQKFIQQQATEILL